MAERYQEGTPLSVEEIRSLERALSDPLAYPAVFKNWLIAFLRNELRGLPLSAVSGAVGIVADFDGPVLTEETRANTAYGVLATAGPEITGLSAGQYVVAHGCLAWVAAGGNIAYQSVSLNGGIPSDDHAVPSYDTARGTPGVMAFLATLNEADSTLACQYRSNSGGTATFGRRWLLSLRVAKL